MATFEFKVKADSLEECVSEAARVAKESLAEGAEPRFHAAVIKGLVNGTLFEGDFTYEFDEPRG